MGGGKSSSTKIYDYCYTLHYAICHGVLDSVNKIFVKDRTIWSGKAKSSKTVSITLDELFGGDLKEGGVNGFIDIRVGNNTQLMTEEAAARVNKTPTTMPAYRGIANLFFRGRSDNAGFKWATNNPYLPAPSVNVTRIPKQLESTYASIPNEEAGASAEDVDDGFKMDVGEGNVVVGTAGFNSLGLSHRIRVEDCSEARVFGGAVANDWERAGTGFRVLRTTTAVTGEAAYDIGLASIGLTNEQVDAGGVELRFYANCAQLGVEAANPTTYTVQIRQFNADYFSYDTGAWVAKPASAIDGTITTTASARISASITLTPGTRYLRMIAAMTSPAEAETVDNQFSQMTGLQMIEATVLDGADANPAHIIYECLTEGEWAMGQSEAAVESSVFIDAAQTLFNEGFGLSLLWTRQTKVRAFIQEVQDHIQASVFVRPTTGKWEMKLYRGDYTVGSLRHLTTDNSRVIEGSRRLWGETINEINIGFTDPVTEESRSITFQDPANIQQQGGEIISTSRDYYGITKSTLAQVVGARDIRESSYPLWSGKVETNRSFWDVVPGDVLVLESPEDGIGEMVVRIQKVDYGRPGARKIILNLTEDVFGLDFAEFEEVESTDWSAPTTKPVNFDFVNLYTMPLPLVLRMGYSLDDLSDADYPNVVIGMMADSRVRTALNYKVYTPKTDPTGDSSMTAVAEFIPTRTGTLTIDLVAEATTLISELLTYAITGGLEPAKGDFFKLGNGDSGEIIMLVSLNTGTGNWTVARGMFDTVPMAWPIGTRAWFMGDDGGDADPTERFSGTQATYKLVPSTGSARLSLAETVQYRFTPGDRPYQPFRPANVQIDGNGFNATIYDVPTFPTDVTITWANRNRLTEDTVAARWTGATVTPEVGQTTTIRLRDLDENLITEFTGLTGTSYVMAATALGGNIFCWVDVYSERDGYGSLTYSRRFLQIGQSGYGYDYGNNYGGVTL